MCGTRHLACACEVSKLAQIHLSEVDLIANLTQDEFDNLLTWLNPNRDLAAKKYREIYDTLVRLFSWRGYHDAEELADEVVDRVMVKAKGFVETYVGDPALYFYGVAKNVSRERDRRVPNEPLTPNLPITEEPVVDEEESGDATLLRECMKKCLRALDRGERELVSSYYEASKRSKITYRKTLAEQLRIETNALRVRVFRIRTRIKQCVEDCLKEKKEMK